MNQKTVSRMIASIIPEIIRGVQFDFFAGRSITQTQFMMLLAVRSYGGCTMGEIAKRMKVAMPTATGVVSRLVRLGYVERVPKPDDRRQVMVQVTPKGESFIREFQEVVADRWAVVLGVLTDKERGVFHGMLSKIQGHLRGESR